MSNAESRAPTVEERDETILSYAGRFTARDDPVFFGGRGAELERLEQCFHHAMRRGRGTITTICGIPGSGKTALAHCFCDHAIAELGAVVVPVDAASLTAPRVLARAIAAAQNEEHKISPAAVRRRRRRKGSFSLGASRTYAAMEFESDQEPPAPMDDEATSFNEDLVRAGSRSDIGVILLVDEAQEVDFQKSRALRVMHHGDWVVPVLPLLVGLRQMRKEFADASLSRLTPGMQTDLGPMSIEDAKDVVAGACQWFWIDKPKSREIADRLAPPTGGFAAHIDAAVAGVALVLSRNGNTLPRHDNVVGECAKEARKFRKEYYELRLDDSKGVPREFFSALASALFDPRTGNPAILSGKEPFSFHSRQVRAACEKSINQVIREEPELFGDTTFTSCLIAADRAGVLEYDALKREVRFPAAPSMVRHILGLPDPEMEGEPARQKDDLPLPVL